MHWAGAIPDDFLDVFLRHFEIFGPFWYLFERDFERTLRWKFESRYLPHLLDKPYWEGVWEKFGDGVRVAAGGHFRAHKRSKLKSTVTVVDNV